MADRPPLGDPGRHRRPTAAARPGRRCPEILRGQLPTLTTPCLVSTCGRLHRRVIWDTETTATAASLRTLARRIQLLNTEISNHTQTVTTLVRAWRPELLTRRGWPDRGRRRPVRLVSPGLLPHRHSLPLLGDAADPASSGQTVGYG